MTETAFDLYMRHTDAEGHTAVRQYRVWDKALFLAAREAEAKAENRKADSPLASAQQITKEQYMKERRK